MISLSAFLQSVQENVNRIHAYEQGHDGSAGKSDCIGLIIGAVRLAGGKWPGTHGSNWAARNFMDGLNRLDSEKDCFPGEIVYKAKEPGESGYSLPSAYKNSPDQRDYCHVGVVTKASPLEITHCTSVYGGIKRDNSLGKWRWGGRLTEVDYEDEGGKGKISQWAVVTAESGKTVNLRKEMSMKSAVIARVPVGTKVETRPEGGDGQWTKAVYGGKTGYIMTEFLQPAGQEEDGPGEDAISVSRKMLETWANMLEEMARDMREKL